MSGDNKYKGKGKGKGKGNKNRKTVSSSNKPTKRPSNTTSTTQNKLPTTTQNKLPSTTQNKLPIKNSHTREIIKYNPNKGFLRNSIKKGIAGYIFGSTIGGMYDTIKGLNYATHNKYTPTKEGITLPKTKLSKDVSNTRTKYKDALAKEYVYTVNRTDKHKSTTPVKAVLRTTNDSNKKAAVKTTTNAPTKITTNKPATTKAIPTKATPNKKINTASAVKTNVANKPNTTVQNKQVPKSKPATSNNNRTATKPAAKTTNNTVAKNNATVNKTNNVAPKSNIGDNKLTFSRAFANARRAGKQTFNWNGKSYTTQLAGEKKNNTSEKTYNTTKLANNRLMDVKENTKPLINTIPSASSVIPKSNTLNIADNNGYYDRLKMMKCGGKRKMKCGGKCK